MNADKLPGIVPLSRFADNEITRKIGLFSKTFSCQLPDSELLAKFTIVKFRSKKRFEGIVFERMFEFIIKYTKFDREVKPAGIGPRNEFDPTSRKVRDLRLDHVEGNVPMRRF